MDFIFGLPADSRKRTGILVFVDRFSKMVHLAAVPALVSAVQSARIFVDTVFRLHGMPLDVVSDRDPRFTVRFWRDTFDLLGVRLRMSTADHPQTDGQTERVNRVLEDILRSYSHAFTYWSECLPMAEFAINNTVHVSTGHTPFFVNTARHPRIPAALGDVPALTGGEPRSSARSDTAAAPDSAFATAESDLSLGPAHETAGSDELPESDLSRVTAGSGQPPDSDSVTAEPDLISAVAVSGGHPVAETGSRALRPRVGPNGLTEDFVPQRQAVVRYIRDSIADAVDTQKQHVDTKGRRNTDEFAPNSLVLLSTKNLPAHAVTNSANKLLPRFVGPFRVVGRAGNAYKLELPPTMRLHPTFYVGRLKGYRVHDSSLAEGSRPQPASSASPSQLLARSPPPGDRRSSPDGRRAGSSLPPEADQANWSASRSSPAVAKAQGGARERSAPPSEGALHRQTPAAPMSEPHPARVSFRPPPPRR